MERNDMRNRKTQKIALVGALALAMSLTASLATAKSADKSTGGVEYTTAVGNPGARASFNAHETPKGQVNLSGVGPLGDIWFHGTVDCYFRTGDNSARFSGEMTETNGPGFTHFYIGVEDNGSPGTSGDRISVQRRMAAVDCEEDPLASPFRDVTGGNLKVHHS